MSGDGGPGTHVVLLRGVMPTGRNKVPMAPLRAELEKAGLADVRTLIQSGNVVARSALGRAELEELVHGVIRDAFGGDIAVLARTAAEFRETLARHPFGPPDPERDFLTLLRAEPDPARAATLLAADFGEDEVRLVGDALFVRIAGRASDSRATNAFVERRLKLAATTRVWRTCTRLLDLAGG